MFVVENLWPDTWYEFTVEAENMFGWSGKSELFKFQTERTGKIFLSKSDTLQETVHPSIKLYIF